MLNKFKGDPPTAGERLSFSRLVRMLFSTMRQMLKSVMRFHSVVFCTYFEMQCKYVLSFKICHFQLYMILIRTVCYYLCELSNICQYPIVFIFHL